MDTQTSYQNAIRFAALKHAEQNQTIPGTPLPYVVHLSNVAMEILLAAQHSANFDVTFAVQVALLHDVLEDTPTTVDELAHEFGSDIAEAVNALTKADDLPKSEKMIDSLTRINALRPEVGAVKLADRITNLQKPPHHWSNAKKQEYLQEATIILETLKGANTYLENRLATKLVGYRQYLDE
ncbi:HD domain-containing protein [Spirosoma gilvum]